MLKLNKWSILVDKNVKIKSDNNANIRLFTKKVGYNT